MRHFVCEKRTTIEQQLLPNVPWEGGRKFICSEQNLKLFALLDNDEIVALNYRFKVSLIHAKSSCPQEKSF